jgi:glycosyltransferase involved in cell wall biosynthesis
MKILYHHRTASKDGQSTHIEEIIRALRQIGHEVEVAAPEVSDHSQTGGSGGWAGRLKPLLPSIAYEALELLYNLIAYRRLATAIRKFRPDIIYERYNLYLLAGAWASRRFRIPRILEINAPMALERRQYGGLAMPAVADRAERFAWRSADSVLPVSDVLANYVAEVGVPRECITVVPNGVDPVLYDRLPGRRQAKQALRLGDELVVGFTGFVREWDRLDRVVRWLASYEGPERPHLLVVGDGPARPGIEECAARAAVSDRVHFTGVIPRAAVPAAAAAFDIALQTALVPYASPLCLFEYLALGVATVAPDQPNHRELLTDGVDALLYDPDDPEGLERTLRRACADPATRHRVAEGGRQLIARRRLTWADHAITIGNIAGDLARQREARNRSRSA